PGAIEEPAGFPEPEPEPEPWAAPEPPPEPTPEPEPLYEPPPAPAEPPLAEPAPTPGAGDDTEGARLIALNMALNGTPRDETDRYLAENFNLADRQALLDEVYSRVG